VGKKYVYQDEGSQKQGASSCPAAAVHDRVCAGPGIGHCASCEALGCVLSHPVLVRTFSPAPPPPSALLTFPDPGAGGWVGVSCREALPEPASSQSPSC